MTQPPFEAIKQTFDTIDYWNASELGVVLGYLLWPDMNVIVSRAMTSCAQKGHIPEDHFNHIVTQYYYTLNGMPFKVTEEYWLSWYACYLIMKKAHQNRAIVASGRKYCSRHR